MLTRNVPSPKQYYRHFKGGTYEVLHIGYSTDDGQQMVIYQSGSCYVWVRPVKEFLEILPDGTPRFVFVGEKF